MFSDEICEVIDKIWTILRRHGPLSEEKKKHAINSLSALHMLIQSTWDINDDVEASEIKRRLDAIDDEIREDWGEMEDWYSD